MVMKNYIRMMLVVAFIAGTHVFAAQNSIVSVSSGPNSLVDAIKQYSDITESDVDKWKFLWLGEMSAIPGLAVGGYATVKAGQAAGDAVEYAQSITVPDW